jgi:hypothetical protein
MRQWPAAPEPIRLTIREGPVSAKGAQDPSARAGTDQKGRRDRFQISDLRSEIEKET